MLKGMTRYLVAVGVAMCVTSVAMAAPGYNHHRTTTAKSPSVHVQVGQNNVVKRSVQKTWVSGKFVVSGRTMRWVPGHYVYKPVYTSCTTGRWTRQYGRDIWVAGKCTVL